VVVLWVWMGMWEWEHWTRQQQQQQQQQQHPIATASYPPTLHDSITNPSIINHPNNPPHRISSHLISWHGMAWHCIPSLHRPTNPPGAVHTSVHPHTHTYNDRTDASCSSLARDPERVTEIVKFLHQPARRPANQPQPASEPASPGA
jgi:hypothetical protein